MEGNEARLGQVFLNLLVNAAQAIPEGSRSSNEIRVVSCAPRAGPRGRRGAATPAAGIPPECCARIFDPFFTTKPVGVGTGLGCPSARASSPASAGRSPWRAQVGRGTRSGSSSPRRVGPAGPPHARSAASRSAQGEQRAALLLRALSLAGRGPRLTLARRGGRRG